MDERVDVRDARGLTTGQTAWKSEAHRLGLWHRCFHCWETPSGGPYLFVQRRAAEKETWPNKLDGLREVEEELGLVVAAGELIPLGTRKAEKEIPAGLDREFQDVFVLVGSLSKRDLKLQEEEVAAVVRLRLKDVEALYEGTGILPEEWTGAETAPISVHLDDFIADEDDYLLRAVLAGERPGALF